jgi:hypothetical protein
LEVAAKLSTKDLETIIRIARKALEKFSSVPDSYAQREPKIGEQLNPEAKTEPESKPNES